MNSCWSEIFYIFDEDSVQFFEKELYWKNLEEWDNINHEHLLSIYTPNAVIAASHLILTALWDRHDGSLHFPWLAAVKGVCIQTLVS